MYQLITVLTLLHSIYSTPFDLFQSTYPTCTLPQLIPPPPITQQQQIQSYEPLSQEFRFFTGDPSLSFSTPLSPKRVVYVMGQDKGQLRIRLSLQFRNHTHTTPPINIYVVECNHTLFSSPMLHGRVISLPTRNTLYAIVITSQSSTQIILHADVDIEYDGPTSINQLVTKVQQTMNVSDRVFVKSIDAWELVQTHRKQHIHNTETMEIRNIMEIIIILIINGIQAVYIYWKLKSKGIV